MKEETSHLIPQKYKGLQETMMNNYVQQIEIPRRNGNIPRNIQPTKSELGRKRKSQQTNNKKRIELVIKNLSTKKI